MDEDSKKILVTVGINFEVLSDLDGFYIPREQLLSDTKYEELKIIIPKLKKKFSSSFMTSLHKNADKEQKWPLLNLVRQILTTYHFKMEPIRKSDGYTLEGVKKYKRFFEIKKIIKNKDDTVNSNENNDTNVEVESEL